MNDEPINFGDINASRQLFNKTIDFIEVRKDFWRKEADFNDWLYKALFYLRDSDSYHMTLLNYLMRELAIAQNVSFENVAVRVYIHDIKDISEHPDYLVNFNPNKEGGYTMLTLVPNPPAEEESDDET